MVEKNIEVMESQSEEFINEVKEGKHKNKKKSMEKDQNTAVKNKKKMKKQKGNDAVIEKTEEDNIDTPNKKEKKRKKKDIENEDDSIQNKKKAKKTKKTKKDDTSVEDEENIDQSNEEGEENNEEEEGSKKKKEPSKRQIKREKAEMRAAEAKELSKQEHAQKALNYVSKWKHAKSEWKFNKVIQIWLIDHLLNDHYIPDDHFSTVMEYFEGCKGAARKQILTKAMAVVKKMEDSIEEDEEVIETTEYKRARHVLQALPTET